MAERKMTAKEAIIHELKKFEDQPANMVMASVVYSRWHRDKGSNPSEGDFEELITEMVNEGLVEVTESQYGTKMIALKSAEAPEVAPADLPGLAPKPIEPPQEEPVKTKPAPARRQRKPKQNGFLDGMKTEKSVAIKDFMDVYHQNEKRVELMSKALKDIHNILEELNKNL